jgi:hypothetical protein
MLTNIREIYDIFSPSKGPQALMIIRGDPEAFHILRAYQRSFF